MTQKYDDASWHYGGQGFPEDRPPAAGATHIGMFFAWIVQNDLHGDEHREDFAEALDNLKARRITPGAYVYTQMDGKLIDSDLSEAGNQFAQHYFDPETGTYIDDYEGSLNARGGNTYAVADSWENFDTMARLIDRRFAEWGKGSRSGGFLGALMKLWPWRSRGAE